MSVVRETPLLGYWQKLRCGANPSNHPVRNYRKISSATMTGKAKPKKHTAKELAAKLDAATTNRGGGKAGLIDRTGLDKGGHAKFECPHCKITAPDVKTMQIHHESKHPKIPFDDTKINNLHAVLAPVVTAKPKPGIRGSIKK